MFCSKCSLLCGQKSQVYKIQKKLSEWFINTDVGITHSICKDLREKEVPELTEMRHSSPISSDSFISSVLVLFLYILLPTMRKIFESTFSNVPFTAINTLSKLLDYIEEIVKSGSTCIRKVRLFTIGHQGVGKTSLIHSVR